MNLGTFDHIAKTYTKYVNINKAVLWMTRQLSLPLPVLSTIKKAGITKIVFIDNGKNEKWTFDVQKVMDRGEQKMVGQEPQWYFPIELAVKMPFKGIYK